MIRFRFTTFRALKARAELINRIRYTSCRVDCAMAAERSAAFDAHMLAADRAAFWNSTEQSCVA